MKENLSCGDHRLIGLEFINHKTLLTYLRKHSTITQFSVRELASGSWFMSFPVALVPKPDEEEPQVVA